MSILISESEMTMTTALHTVRATLSLVDPSKVDNRTHGLRALHSTASRFAVTQAWTFSGGDALVIITNRINEPMSALIVIRMADTVQVLSGYRGVHGVFENPPVWFAQACEAQLR